LLAEAAFCLRALGRLTEALEPMRAALEMGVEAEDWAEASRRASNLSELELTLGEVGGAVRDAEQSVTYADRSRDLDWPGLSRTTHADALHQAGRRDEAESRFGEAEQMQEKRQPEYPLLYSQQGFIYCDLLLAGAEQAAWRHVLAPSPLTGEGEGVNACRAVSQRAAQTLKWVTTENWLLDIALDHLTLGRAALYEAILTKSEVRGAKSEVDQGVSGLRRAGTTHHVPRALLTRAWLRFLTGTRIGPESAQEDLDEAWEIAERGPMKLHMADIHLYRARLFGRMRDEGGSMKYPWESPAADLAAARKLIESCGYGRRKEELEDAEAAIGLGHK
jgi:tetratricopeptide (TPR) repeat protein